MVFIFGTVCGFSKSSVQWGIGRLAYLQGMLVRSLDVWAAGTDNRYQCDL